MKLQSTSGRTLLCGVDTSRGASRTVRAACDAARVLRLTPVLVHVVEPPGAFPYGNERRRELERRDAEQHARAVLDELTPPQPHAERRVEFGSPGERLLEAADELDAAALVVGCRGARGVKAALVGSTSRWLISHSARPVIVVPPDVADRAVPSVEGGTILAGVDGSDHSVAAVATAEDIARAAGAELVLVGVYTPATSVAAIPAPFAMPVDPHVLLREAANAADAALRDASAHVDSPARTVPLRARPAESVAAALTRCALDENASLIVLGSRGRNPVTAAVAGSVSHELAATAPVPIVVVPSQETRHDTKDEKGG